MISRKFAISLGALVAGCTIASGTAFAQAAEGTGSADEQVDVVGVGDIVVTANRRESTVQKTPAVISAFSAGDLAKSGVNGSVALQNAVPGLSFTSGNNGQTLIYLRGIGTSILGLGAGTSVASYVDGVYLSNQQQALQKFNTIERIEILKGPQATLYGRNATGGAINIITREPGQETRFDADASYGNYNAVTARASVSGAVSDSISALVSFLVDRHDGYNRNLTLGDRPGAEDTIGARAALRFDLGGNSKFVLRGDYTYSEFSDYIKDINPGSFLYRFTPTSDYVPGYRNVRSNIKNSSRIRDFGIGGTLSLDLDFGTLTSVTSYRRFQSGPSFIDIDSNDGAIIPALGAIQQINGDRLTSNQYYQEAYLATDRDARVFATIGGNYHREHADQFIFRPTTINFTGIGTVPQTYQRRLEDDTWSVFIDAGLNITDDLTVTAGVRYSRDDKFYSQVGIFPGPGIPAGLVVGRRSDKSVSPRFGIEYRATPDVMFYASVTSGFKAGGFAENDPRNSFKPEKIWSYEAGVKSTFLDNRARFNISGFYAEYTDIQVQQLIGAISVTRLITNAEGAKIWGFDFDASFVPVTGLKLAVSGEYLHTRTGSASLCSPIAPCTGATAPFNGGIQNIAGNPLPNAPEWSLVGSVDYAFNIGTGKLLLRGDASYHSFAYFNYFGIQSLANGTPLGQPAYVNINAQVRYDSPNGWFMALYGRNLTNRTVLTWSDIASQFSSTLPLTNFGTVVTGRFAPPRTYGVTLGVSF